MSVGIGLPAAVTERVELFTTVLNVGCLDTAGHAIGGPTAW